MDFKCTNLLLPSGKKADHVGQVVLMLGVIVSDFYKRLEQDRRVEDVDAGIDFSNFKDLGRCIAVLDNRTDFVGIVPDDAPVAVRILEIRGQHRCAEPAFMVKSNECLECRGFD